METDPSRRDVLSGAVRAAALLGIGGALGALIPSHARGETAWQIDPYKCIQCGKCATECVLEQSAVKCFHSFGICGYCKPCSGYFHTEPGAVNTGVDNQMCPTDALKRKFIEDPYYEYTIDADLCIACGFCVKGCSLHGNGSLHLQIDQSRCLHCNWCSIAAKCPATAISRVPADNSYKLKTRTRTS